VRKQSAYTLSGVGALDLSATSWRTTCPTHRVSAVARLSTNHLAASLRQGRSNLIGVLLPDIRNTVFAPILGGIADICRRTVMPRSSPMLATTPRNKSPSSTGCGQRIDG
jgi:hypothetical protein